MENSLVETAKKTAHDLIAMSAMNGDQIKREMDANYLSTLVSEHPNLDRKYFVDFITKCQLTGADPRLGQAYLTVYNSWNRDTNSVIARAATIFDYKFLIMKAEQTGELDDISVDCVEEPYLDISTGKRRPSYTAIAIVKRNGRQTRFKARFWEFCKTDKNGMPNGNWKVMPTFMIEKCAVANALRWAFPEALGSIYIDAEMERVIADKQKVSPPVQRTLPPVEQVKPQTDDVIIENEVPQQEEPFKIKLTYPDIDIEALSEKNIRDDLSSFFSTCDERVIKMLGKDRGILIAGVLTETDLDKLRHQYKWLLEKFVKMDDKEIMNDRIENAEGNTDTEVI